MWYLRYRKGLLRCVSVCKYRGDLQYMYVYISFPRYAKCVLHCVCVYVIKDIQYVRIYTCHVHIYTCHVLMNTFYFWGTFHFWGMWKVCRTIQQHTYNILRLIFSEGGAERVAGGTNFSLLSNWLHTINIELPVRFCSLQAALKEVREENILKIKSQLTTSFTSYNYRAEYWDLLHTINIKLNFEILVRMRRWKRRGRRNHSCDSRFNH